MAFANASRYTGLEGASSTHAITSAHKDSSWLDDVKKVTDEIDCAKHCNGINGPKFDQFVTKHNVRCFDHSGKIHMHSIQSLSFY